MVAALVVAPRLIVTSDETLHACIAAVFDGTGFDGTGFDGTGFDGTGFDGAGFVYPYSPKSDDGRRSVQRLTGP